jgi:hypothetical protein
MEVKNEAHQYQWIVNEGLLRDEGTIYGIAGAAIQEKTEAIRNYYLIKRAALRAKQEHLGKVIEELNTGLLEPLAGSADLAGGSSSFNLIPVTLQLLLYIGICYFNFFLELYWLSPVLHSTIICIGLYSFGLFSVFIGRSIMYNSSQSLSDEKPQGERREMWKIYLEEFGVPLIVSLFISILPANSYPRQLSVFAALFFFLLFLLGGKGLVNTFFRFRTESGLRAQSLGKKKDRYLSTQRLLALQEDLCLTLGALEELNGDEAYRINIFTSEYKLAFESRQLAQNMPVKRLA